MRLTVINKFLIQEWFQDGFAAKWNPMWSYCNPCLENMEPTSLMEFKHLNEDKNFIFDQIGFEYKFTWALTKNPEPPGDVATQQKYYSTLSKQDINELYIKYHLDHELFGYKPDFFISMGKP